MPESPSPRRATTRDLFAVGMVVISLVLLTMVLLAIWLQGTSHNGTKAAVESVLTSRADAAAGWVADYVEATESTTHGLALWLGEAPRSTEEIKDQLLLVAVIDDQLTSTGVGYSDGSWVGIRQSQSDDHAEWIVSTVEASDGAWVQVLEVYDEHLHLLTTSQNELPILATEFAFWEPASAASDVVWVEAEPTELLRDAGVWAAEPVRATDGSLQAVVATEFPVDAMTSVLEEVVLGDAGGLFLLDEDRTVIASPLGVDDIATISVGPTPNPTFESLVGRTLESLGVATSEAALPGDGEVVIGYDGEVHTAELGLSDLGVPWVLHLRAVDEELAPAILDLQSAVSWASGILLLVLVGASALFFYYWRPVRDMHRRANTDMLTGLLRRARFLELAPQALAESRRVGHSSCAVVLDLDNFKTLNDSLGHETGDAALERVGMALRAATRTTDLVSRWGGDEFVVLLELLDPEDALFAVERLREQVEAHLREEFPEHPDLGVTAGGAVSCGDDCDIERMVREADEALVSGKRLRKSRSYMAVA